ncbi:3-deoxy-7-phosphoheptulonate synthase [Streptococcus iniae]|uniref:bifunctional 3-deoxy-7-phosphoheptulonate synthase/chorismate mutase n=1 Tax=Streptococcus iniae TaxID=1346 RepID=UPI000EF64CF5|nr:bifunctional 3-deoxy-7-phosphoheptulonate synthase/chorismate mutase [Streptococcus iniae]RLU28190.1 3-deoxy-7-phosphoheptulonate synthase [Streptococcus iniae]RLU30117.1 3-deoxy-7-phosphoheptulonate synthase [Streptococcus iniae]
MDKIMLDFSSRTCDKNNFIVGPCSIESYEQIRRSAEQVKRLGYKYFRGGAYKPRTNSESFQGLGVTGVRYLQEVCQEFSLKSVSEIMSAKQLEEAYDYLDLIQIGSRNMQNFELLKELSTIEKPILFKRGLMSTISEYLGALSHLQENGKKNIILCERGVRGYDVETRNMLDIMAVPIIQQKVDLPIIVDVSHSTGRRDLLLPAAKIARAIGANGIMMEVHPNPEEALSDAEQQINYEQFEELGKSLWS